MAPLSIARRTLATALLGAAALAPVAALAGPAEHAKARTPDAPGKRDRKRSGTASSPRVTATPGLQPDAEFDQSVQLQAAIDEATLAGQGLELPAGRFRVSGLKLHPGSMLRGASQRTVLTPSGPGPLLRADGAHGMRIERLAIDAVAAPAAGTPHAGLVEIVGSRDIVLSDLRIRGGAANGIVLERCGGRVCDAVISGAAGAGVLSLDAQGLTIENSRISDCANNGILVWRTAIGDDGTRITGNRIERIAAADGGTGQNGNGVNVFRAGNVLVTNNRITDCAFSAIRGNAASNIQMVANACQRLGEVALYAEFGFEGALIASNVVDTAASGIAVTNFNEGGRLAVVQGNLVRNLRRREHEPVDKRGEGISVEADAAVTGNTVEAAETAGIVIGWGPYMRDVVATGNVIRQARVGIMISRHPSAGAALVAQNLISGARNGAIRLMDNGVVEGPDLVTAQPLPGRLVVTANVAVDNPA